MNPQEYSDLFSQPVKKRLHITVMDTGDEISNNNIVSESMSIEESLCSEENLKFGCCESSCFKIKLADIDIKLKDKWLLVEMDIVTDKEGYVLLQDDSYLLTQSGERLKMTYNEVQRITLGRFKVYSDKLTADKSYRDIVCYDIMRDLLALDVTDKCKSIFEAYKRGVSISTFLDELFEYVHSLNEMINYDSEQSAPLHNQPYIVDFPTDEGIILFGDVLAAIGELNGEFGNIDRRTGNFCYVDLNNIDAAIRDVKLDHYIDGTCVYEDYFTDSITGVIAKGEDEDDAGISVGTNENVYTIRSNPILYGLADEDDIVNILGNLLGHIHSITGYRPFSVSTYGNPLLPLGMHISIFARNQVVSSYIIKKNMTGIQALHDKLSATGEKKYPNDGNSISAIIAKNNKRVNTLTKEIVLKVQQNGALALAKLGADPETGETSFVVKAGNFEVDEEGNVTIRGDITANKALLFDYYAEDSEPFELINTETFSSSPEMPAYVSIKTSDGLPVINIYNDAIMEHALDMDYMELRNFYASTNALFLAGMSIKGNAELLDNSSIVATHPNIDISSDPQEYSYKTTYRDEDINNNLIGFIGPDQATDGTIKERFAACRDVNGEMIYNRIRVGVMPNGSRTVDVDAPTEWRTAIGAAAASSKDYKKNIKPISDDEANKILSVKVYSFDYKKEYGNKNQFGVIAEEVKNIIPYAVNEGQITSVDYWKFIPHLIKKVQMQEVKISSLEERIVKLEKIIKDLAIETLVNNSMEGEK